jgi:hypothetical protein
MRMKPCLVVFWWLVPLCGAAAGARACAIPAQAPTVRLAGPGPGGDPLLDDGRLLRLVGIAPRQSTAEAAAFAAGIDAHRGQAFRLHLMAEPDRWGRLPARLLRDGAAPGPDLAALLVASGSASRLAEAGADCIAWPREAGIGAAGLLDGHDPAALAGQAGRLVWLHGRIASVGERRDWTYLNFSRRRGEAAAIMVPRTLWRELRRAGWTARSLGGKRIRAQGILSGRDGLLLEVSARAALELVD